MNVNIDINQPDEINLARLRAFSIGELQVDPARLEIKKGAKIVRLEPRCMKVLVALADEPGAAVSRETLLWKCWAGKIVTDGSLNRCVAQIRKALALDPSVTIETIPRIGYSLTLPRPGPTTRTTETSSKPTFYPWLWGSAALLGLCLTGLMAAFGKSNSPTWHAMDVRPLTTAQGVETYPALSLDGRRLAYAAYNTDGRSEIFYLHLDNMALEQLTNGPQEERWPVFSPSGEKLAFVRRTEQTCHHVERDDRSGLERVIAPCIGNGYSRIAYADENTLIVSRPSETSPTSQLVALDTLSGAARPLTSPIIGTHGDVDPVVSSDGRRIAFRRTASWGVDDIMVAERSDTGELLNVRALMDDGWKAHGMTWTADGQHLVFTSNRGGNWGLWTANLVNNDLTKIEIGTSSLMQITAGPGDVLVAQSRQPRSAVSSIDGELLVRQNTNIWSPVVETDGTLTFVSFASGSPELWQKSTDRPARALTNLRSSYLHGPTWTSEGTIIFIAIADRAPQLFEYDPASEQINQRSFFDGDKRDPQTMRDGTVLFLHRGPSGWQLAHLPEGAREPVLRDDLGADWKELRRGPLGLFGSRENDKFLWEIQFHDGLLQQKRTAYQTTDGPWAVGAEGIAQIVDGQLIEAIAGSEEVRPLGVVSPNVTELAYDPVQQSYLVVDRTGEDSDLHILALRFD